MAGEPDPKPAARVVDRAAVRRASVRNDECTCCERPGTNQHHVIPKSERGDDVPENLLMLCGSGSHGCHGALHGSPYVDANGRRWTGADVRARLGLAISRRPAMILYVADKLGTEAGLDYLRRRYFLDVPVGMVERLRLMAGS